MKLSVYFSEDKIQVVLGREGKRPRIVERVCYELEPGTLINGVTVREEAVREALIQIRERFRGVRKRVCLVSGSSLIITRVLEIPALLPQAVVELAERELEGLNGEAREMVYDYAELAEVRKKGAAKTVLCAAMERRAILSYQELFAGCGLRLISVNAALEAVFGAVGCLPFLSGRTYILAILDGRSMRTAFYVRGHYTYASQVRLISERDTGEILGEIAEGITAIVRFNQTLKTESGIERIYLSGLYAGEEGLTEGIAQKTGIETEVLDGGLESGLESDAESGLWSAFNEHLYAVGNLLKPCGKRLNFIKAAKRRGGRALSRRGVWRAGAALPVLLFLCLFCAFWNERIAIRGLEKRVERLQLEQEEAGVQARYQELLELQKQGERLEWKQERRAETERELDRYGQIGQEVLEALFLLEGEVRLLEVSFEEGSVRVRGETVEAGGGGGYGKRLEGSGLFETVEYGGFSLSRREEGERMVYEFETAAVLRQAEGEAGSAEEEKRAEAGKAEEGETGK